jgi:alkaline phosphatase D
MKQATMPTSKSIASDSSNLANCSTTVSEFIQNLSTSVFPLMSPGCEDTTTANENRCKEDPHNISTMLDPIEFTNRKNNHNNNSNRNYNNEYYDKDFCRNTSNQTDLKEEDTAWFYTGNEGTAMYDHNTDTDDGSTLRDEDDSTVLVGASRSKKIHRRNRNRNPRPKQRSICDTTTLALLVLCIVLTLILVILASILYPFRSSASNIKNSSDGVVASSANDQTSTKIPRIPQTPESAANSSPTRDPTGNPTTRPTAWPTAFVPWIPSSSATEPKEEESSPPQNEVVAIPPVSMGPLVGHTTHDSVTLWAYFVGFANHNSTMEILLYDYGTDALIMTVDSVAPRKDRNNAIIETIKGLQPETSYKYGMHIFGERVGKGSFTTAPHPNHNNKGNKGGGTTFDYILTSCMNYRQYKNQMVWDVIVEKLGGKYPDFSILSGDTVYLQEGIDITENGVDFDRLWFRNQEQRTEQHFAKFVQNVPTYATWNDHEYGSNNANKDQKGKTNSLRAWESLWANPGYGDESTDDGVYYSYYWGDVHYIITDDHWYRDPSKDNRLGIKQTEWIEDELVNSKGTFKVIVIGSDIMERGWSSDLDNIGTIVREHSVDGVVFHAGDIHRNEYKEMIAGGFPYPVKQITSSGIAKVWRRPFVHIAVDTQADDPTMTAFFYGASSTADVTTWTNDPSLVCTSIEGVDRTKEHTCTETIRLSDLTVP